MDTIVNVEVRCSKAELKRAISYYILNIHGKTGMRLYFVTSGILVLLVFALALAKGFSGYYLGLLGVFVICGLLFFFMYYIYPLNRYVDVYEKGKGRAYSFSEQEITSIGEGFHFTFSWSLFRYAYEIPSAFLFLDENKFIYVFPKACFHDSSDIGRLRDIVNYNIGNSTIRGQIFTK